MMNYTAPYALLFLTGTAFSFLLSQGLHYAAYRNRRLHGTEVAPELAGHIDAATLQKACAYKNARYRLWVPQSIVGLLVTLALGLVLYRRFFLLTVDGGNAYKSVLLFALLCCIPEELAGIPFSLWREFRIEKRYGFSTMTPALWLRDYALSLLLGAAMGAVLLCAAVFLLLHTGGWWWLLLAGAYLLFSLIVSYIYPVWIAPLFNKFTPLPDGELRERLVTLLAKCGFTARGMFVMDASRRSRHSNAYFTGLGRNKRIVLYDTLLQQLSPAQTEAVLAHELGHYKKRHLRKQRCVMVPLVLAVLYVVSRLVWGTGLYEAFGLLPQDAAVVQALRGRSVPAGMEHLLAAYRFAGVCLLGMTAQGFMPLVELVANTFSRRHEFEADAVGASLCGSGKPLADALVVLNRENLSEVTPPPLYVLFYYSHPPLLERVRALAAEG